MFKVLKYALATLTLALAVTAGHSTHLYGMPWDGPAVESVGCLQPAPDGPVTVSDVTYWPAVCDQWTDAPALNSGVGVSLWGPFCFGVEVRGAPGPFWRFPLIGGNTNDC